MAKYFKCCKNSIELPILNIQPIFSNGFQKLQMLTLRKWVDDVQILLWCTLHPFLMHLPSPCEKFQFGLLICFQGSLENSHYLEMHYLFHVKNNLFFIQGYSTMPVDMEQEP